MIPDGYSIPIPYPDELWYSIIARYHLQSGNLRQVTSCRDLFQRQKESFSVLLPDADMEKYFQLRELDTKDAVETFTMSPFALRFYTEEKKELALDGKLRYELLGAWDHLRYCPMCLAEDIATYGETYWHRSHQIPYATACPKHGCKIEDSMVTIQYARYHLSTANEYVCPSKNAQETSSVEKLYASYLDFFLQQPLRKTIPIIRLISHMEEQGIIRRKNGRCVCNTSMIYSGLKIKFGEKMTEWVFPKQSIKTNLRRMLFSNTSINTAQFALLYAYLEIPESKIFMEQQYQDPKMQKLLNMSQSGLVWSRISAAKEIGVSVDTLVRMTEEMGIGPFWRQVKKGEHAAPQISIKIYLSKEEKEKIERVAKESKTANTSLFLKKLILKNIEP